MDKDIFFIPHLDNFILYAPLKGIISLINNTAVKELEKINSNENNEKDLVSNANTICEFSSFQSISNITFILTSNCTMSCIYCYANGGNSKKTINWDTFSNIVDYIITKNKRANYKQITNISFHGGDISSVWKLFKNAIKCIEEKFQNEGLKFSVTIGINGILSKKQQEFILAHTNNATVSLDGYSIIQNFNRPLTNGKSSFGKVDKTLKIFDINGYRYGIRSTITDKSVTKLAEIIEFFCLNYKAKKIMMEPLFPLGRGLMIKEPSPEDFVINFRKAKLVAKSFNRELVYSGARLNDTTSIFCKALEDSVVITPEGLISCCYEIIDNDTPVAEYFIHGYFDENKKELVFDKQKQLKLLEYIKKENEKCEDCFCKFHCAGDCPVKTISLSLNPIKNTTDRCYINRELTKDLILEALGE